MLNPPTTLFTRLAVAGLLLALVAYYPPVSDAGPADDTIRRSFSVQPGGTLAIDTDRGSIQVAVGESSTLEVEVRREAPSSEVAERFSVAFDEHSDGVRIRGRTDAVAQRRGWDQAPQVQFRITVPRRYNTVLETHGGSISVNELQGRIEVRTAGGSLRFGGIEGTIRGQTSGGSISLQGLNGDARLRTSGGSIQLEDVRGEVDVQTSGGSITATGLRGAVNARTSGGAITARLAEPLTGNTSLETSGGSIRVRVPDNIGLSIDAQANHGRIRTNLPLAIEESRGGDSLRGTLGEGGPLLRLRTSAGSIRIDRE